MNILEKIVSYSEFNRADDTYSKMMRTILANIHKIKNYNIYDIAELCYTSPTSIGRMCKKLGYKGYYQFHKELMTMYEGFAYRNYIIREFQSDSITDIKNKFADVATEAVNWIRGIDNELIESLIRMMYESERVYCIDFLPATDRVLSLAQNLAVSGKQMYHTTDEEEARKAIKQFSSSDIVVFIVPDLAEASFMWNLYEMAVNSPAKVVLVRQTDFRRKLSDPDLLIEFKGVKSSMDEIFMNVFWKMIAFCYRSRYMDV